MNSGVPLVIHLVDYHFTSSAQKLLLFFKNSSSSAMQCSDKILLHSSGKLLNLMKFFWISALKGCACYLDSKSIVEPLKDDYELIKVRRNELIFPSLTQGTRFVLCFCQRVNSAIQGSDRGAPSRLGRIYGPSLTILYLHVYESLFLWQWRRRQKALNKLRH